MAKDVYVIVEEVGPSIYERYTLPFVYMKRDWAEYQCKILQNQADLEGGGKHRVIAFQVIDHGPKKTEMDWK